MENSQKNVGTALGQLGVIQKPWAEQTTEEKLESVRLEIRDFNYFTNRIVELENKIYQLENHSHTNDGKVSVAISLVNNRGTLNGALRHSRLN